MAPALPADWFSSVTSNSRAVDFVKMVSFGIDSAQILGLFMESILYGIYLSTFKSCFRALLWSDGHLKPRRAMNFTMILAAVAMLVFGSLDVAFGLKHNLDAFVYSGGRAEAEFAQISNWVNVMKFVDYVGQTFVGDMILLYRCFIVYERNWLVVIIPSLMCLAETACGIAIIYIEATFHADAFVNQPRIVPFITSMLSLTLATNALTTSLIVHRIWSVKSQTSKFSGNSFHGTLSRVIRAMVESGLIYTTSIVILFITYMLSNNAQYPISDAVVQIIGITFNLIIIQTNTTQTPLPSEYFASSDSTSIPMHIAVSVSRKQEFEERMPAHSESKVKRDMVFGDGVDDREWQV